MEPRCGFLGAATLRAQQPTTLSVLNAANFSTYSYRLRQYHLARNNSTTSTYNLYSQVTLFMSIYDSTVTSGTKVYSYLTGNTSNTCSHSGIPSRHTLLDIACTRNVSMLRAHCSMMYGPIVITRGLVCGEPTKHSTHRT